MKAKTQERTSCSREFLYGEKFSIVENGGKVVNINWTKYRIIGMLDAFQELRIENGKLVSVEDPRVKQSTIQRVFVDKGKTRIAEVSLEADMDDWDVQWAVSEAIAKWEREHRPKLKREFFMSTTPLILPQRLTFMSIVEGERGYVRFEATAQMGNGTTSTPQAVYVFSKVERHDEGWVARGATLPGERFQDALYLKPLPEAAYRLLKVMFTDGSEAVLDALEELYFEHLYEEDETSGAVGGANVEMGGREDGSEGYGHG